MKTKFFRENKMTSLPPTPSQGGGARHCEGEARSNLLPPLGGRLGWSLLLFLCPVLLAAQNGVSVSNLALNAGTVTFDVSWNKNAMPVTVWNDSVWVFVDYNDAGVMKRLPLLPGATLTATSAPGSAAVIQYDGNDKGVWVVGNARSAGSFSATVRVQTPNLGVFAGACAYASNYPPVAEYVTPGTVKFTGTPPFDLKLSSGMVSAYDSYNLLQGETLEAFTDKTGAPGVINCIPMSGDIDFAVPGNLPISQPLSFSVAENPLTPDAAAITYTWRAPDFNPETYTGTPFNTAAPSTSGTYLVTLTAHSMGYCDLPKTKDVPVVNCLSPTTYSLSASATVICNGVSVTFTLSGSQDGATYQLYKDDSTPVGEMVVANGRSIIFSTMPEVGVYTVHTVDGGTYCNGTVSQASVVMANALPGDIGQTQTGGSCSGNPGVIGASITTTCQNSPGVIGIK